MKALPPFLRFLGFLLLFGLPSLQAADRPNVVLLLADDLGYGDVSCYGCPDIKTPHIDKLSSHIPGGANVRHGWDGDRLNLTVEAMGQAIEAQIDVEETKVHCHILLPGMLALFAAPIEAMLKKRGNDLLLEDKRD